MIFRNIVFSAIMVGILSGLVFGLFQQLKISPIIFSSEKFEVNSSGTAGQHSHLDHEKKEESWGGSSDSDRFFWTLFLNILTGISFSLVMLSLMTLHNFKSTKPKINAKRGIWWGLVGMLSIFVMPALLGLHPEIPGTLAAELEYRQFWWTFCAFSTFFGIALLYYMPLKLKSAGILLIALPHIIGAPLPETNGFSNVNPFAVTALTELSLQFYFMTTIGMLIFFVVLGVASGYATDKYLNFSLDK